MGIIKVIQLIIELLNVVMKLIDVLTEKHPEQFSEFSAISQNLLIKMEAKKKQMLINYEEINLD